MAVTITSELSPAKFHTLTSQSKISDTQGSFIEPTILRRVSVAAAKDEKQDELALGEYSAAGRT